MNQQILQRTPPQHQPQSNSPQQQHQLNNQQSFPIQNQQILIQSPQHQSQGQITQQFIIQQSPGQMNLNQPSPQNAGTNQQIITHPISPSPSQSGQPQQTIMQNQSTQKIHIQSQVVIAGQQIQSQSPQSPQIAVQSPPTFIRAARPVPQWVQGQPAPQRQLIHLDAQTHAHIQTMEPIQRAEYLAKLQRRNMLIRQQVAFQARPGIVTNQRPTGTQHIIVRGQVPAGLTQQQQMQWLQQQRPILVRSAAPGLSPISAPGGATQMQTQFPVDATQGQFQRTQIPQAAQKPIQSGMSAASPKIGTVLVNIYCLFDLVFLIFALVRLRD